jgi:solute carrier family 25 2-oxodicarboxylate transporter 21
MRALKMSSAGGEQFSLVDFYKTHGLKGFVSQGVLPELLKSSSMRVSKFFFFPIVCEGLFNKKVPKASGLEKGIAGALATVPEILMISPMEVAKIGLQLDRENKYKNNSTAFAKHIYQTRGISGLYCGWAGMQWRQSWWTGTYFATLSWWKSKVEPPLKEMGAPITVANIISGFFAGCFATIPNAPGDVVRSVVQKKLFQDATRKAYGVSPGGVMEHIAVAREIVAARGIAGLYAGFGFKAMHLGGSGSLMAALVPIFSNMFGIPYSGV